MKFYVTEIILDQMVEMQNYNAANLNVEKTCVEVDKLIPALSQDGTKFLNQGILKLLETQSISRLFSLQVSLCNFLCA